MHKIICLFLILLVAGQFSFGSSQHSSPAASVASREKVDGSQPVDNSFAVRDVRVFDGESVIQHETVIVHDGLIQSVSQSEDFPKGIKVIEGRGKTLIPGLIDSHVHVFPGAQHDALRFGVTTEMDMFNVSHEFAKWRAQRDSLAKTDEADTWSAGTGITVPGGHPTEMGGPPIPTLASATDAAPFVDARVAEGSDYIKLIVETGSEWGMHFKTLSDEELRAAIAEADRLGKITIAHHGRKEDASRAMSAGVRGLAHMFYDGPVDPEFIKLAKDRNVFFVPTLSTLAGPVGTEVVSSVVEDPAVSPFLSKSQKMTLSIKWKFSPNERLAKAEANTEALFKAGIPVLAGTDAPVPGEAHGVTLHEELTLLVKAGLTPAEALNAATAKPAAIFGLWDRGRIAPGLRADMLLIDGDPTQDITRTRHIDVVWKNGFPIQRMP